MNPFPYLFLMPSFGVVVAILGLTTLYSSWRETNPQLISADLTQGFGLFMTGLAFCLLGGTFQFSGKIRSPGFYVLVAAWLISAIGGWCYAECGARMRDRETRRLFALQFTP